MLSINQTFLLAFFLLIFGLKYCCLSSILKFSTKFGQFENDVQTHGWKKEFEIDGNMDEILDEWFPGEENPPENEENTEPEESMNDVKETHIDQDTLDGIGFLVEGIERSDFGISKPDSDYQRSRPALGFRQCGSTNLPNSTAPTIIKMFYKSQLTADNYEPEAIRVLCYSGNGVGMANFCACDEGGGTCYRPMADNPPVYAELAPFCDPIEGCHVYLELYQGALHAERNVTQIYTHRFDAGPFGHGSPYMKLGAVGCGGCARIGPILRGEKEQDECRGEFMKNTMDEQNLSEMLFCDGK